ncbi:TetR/AcrR family transcriptional regulator [Azoarcus olearius]|uniref:TetR family transcriptional regulator n=1 Tax=Azoarcus sp. (strain BH72) TaxID=418699 RepID=A1K205_AZOSB|nr:TetR/AcrR family transcriptional regulator [Azoarcus olearius]CAL92860.1 putative TetR family transcriptional regulator [Azoarcus olearius]
MTADRSPVDAPRAEARRAQILDAAVACFRAHGFHGASIAQISKAAGMSAGHIYHYFDNKEAIIAAIVEQDLERLLTLTAEMRSARDVLEAMIERAAEGVRDNLDPASVGLKLEIVAEASRNPRVAEIVRQADATCRDSLAETLRAMRANCGHRDDEAAIAGLTEVLAAMFGGLMIRSVRNPDLEQDTVIRMFQRVIRFIITDALAAPAPGEAPH